MKYLLGCLVFNCWALSFTIAQPVPCGVTAAGSDAGRAYWQSHRNLYLANARKTTGIKRILPIVVTIVYENANDAHNISDAQIRSQILATNTHLDGALGGVDTEIGLCLAGIRRFSRSGLGLSNSLNQIGIGPGLNEIDLKSATQLNPDDFLNVWLVGELFDLNGRSVAGYAYFPWEVNSAATSVLDGILMRGDQFGRATGTVSSPYDLGATFTHELGHYLGLLHPWGTNCHDQADCQTEGDCCDTPIQDQEISLCKRENSCKNESPDLDDAIHNFMQFTPDACRSDFTQCQSDRMNQVLTVDRASLFVCEGERCPTPKMHAVVQPKFECYPNPFADQLTISFTMLKADQMEIGVFDPNGVQVYGWQERLESGAQKLVLEARAWHGSAGVYFVIAKLNGGVITKKVIRR